MRREDWLERDLTGDTSGHEAQTEIWLASAAKVTLRSRPLLAAALLGSAGACLAGAWAFLWAIPVFYALRFAGALLTGRVRQAALRRAREQPLELPPGSCFGDGRARSLVERLRGARQAVERAIGAGPVGAAFDVKSLVEGIPRLERDVLALAARVEYLKRFLDSSPPDSLVAELGELEKKRDGSDAELSKLLDRVILRYRERFDLLSGLASRADRAYAVAEELVAGIEQVPARIVRLQLTRLESCDVRSVDAREEALAVLNQFGALEGAICELQAGASPPQ
ncbi:MAG TPA: hypothetical protein VMT03_16430 [Polyangia bacterium]|nr:hypothetical protein [Polyangia bacterium]